jgi:hypothetical protein|tara:strand:- start:635 stop:868 length:234 start_codon:yes stop_codon:yes gene_type:complete
MNDIKDKHLDKEVDKLVNRLAKKKGAIDHPDARLHQLISFIKSGVRIVGYFFIPFNLVAATALLILSEVIGIIEELV